MGLCMGLCINQEASIGARIARVCFRGVQKSSGSVFGACKNRPQKAARVARKRHFKVSRARIRVKIESVWRIAGFNKADAQEFHIKLYQCGGIVYQK